MAGLTKQQPGRTSGPADRPAGFAEVLRRREFRALWLAELQSVAGDQLARVALSILVFDRTASAGLTALTYALTYLPDLVSGPLLGGLVDRLPRRRVLLAADLARFALVGLMAVPGLPLPVVAVLVVAMQMFAAPFAAAQAATLRVALTDARFAVAAAMRQTSNQLAQMIGFAAGGVLVVALGPHLALAINAATFLTSAVLIRTGVRWRPAPAAGPDAPTTQLGRITGGARIVWRNPTLRSLAAVTWLAAFIVTPEALMVPYAAEIGAGPAAAGWLLAAFPAGFVAGGLLIGRLLTLAQQQGVMGVLAVAAMLPLIVFAARPPVVVAVPLLALAGACGTYQIAAFATFAGLVPDRWRGQVFGLLGSVLIGVQGLGLVGGGVLAQAVDSPGAAIALAGGAGLVVGVWAARGWHQHRPPPPTALSSPGQTAPRPDQPGDTPGETEGRGRG